MKRINQLYHLPIAFAGLYAFNALSQPLLNPNLEWYGNNRQQLEKILIEHGSSSTSYHTHAKPVAVFDFDNTTIKNDVGDATTFWLLTHNLIIQPKDWHSMAPNLTDDAVNALNITCSPLAKPGQPLITHDGSAASSACADEIASMYDKESTAAGKPAFTHKADSFYQPAYAFAVQLLAGHTPNEVRQIATDAIAYNLSQPLGSTQKIGSKDGFTAYMRQYKQIQDLMSALKKSGFDVWIVSASNQYVVEAFAKRYGINPQHVIGVRSMLKNNRLMGSFQGVGHFSDQNTEVISYKDGKRYWINKIIFNAKNAEQQEQTAFNKRLVLVAGDSDTDLSMLKDARYKLVINRNKDELMCNAYANVDGGWLVNPMFIQAKKQKTAGYSCKKWGLSDQTDNVYTP